MTSVKDARGEKVLRINIDPHSPVTTSIVLCALYGGNALQLTKDILASNAELQSPRVRVTADD